MVMEWKYLGITLKTQTRKKAIGTLKQMWSIGERKYEGDYKMKMMQFDSMVYGILYGVKL